MGRDRELRRSRSCSTPPPRTARRTWSSHRRSPGSASRGWRGSSSSTSTASRHVCWHRGRCLAYGEGVAYWALAEMVRTRARIPEDEDAGAARAEARRTPRRAHSRPEERAWVGPRLANLLGLEERAAPIGRTCSRPGGCSSSGWPTRPDGARVRGPPVGRPGAARLRRVPARVVALPPALRGRAGAAGARRAAARVGRRAAQLHLARPRAALGAGDGRLLDGFVPGLPEELQRRILARAEGVPLYAVETVRMLLDRGLLAQEGSVYPPTGQIDELEVPESLHAPDRCAPRRAPRRGAPAAAGCRGARQDLREQALAALTGVAEAELEPLLTRSFARRCWALQADPRSPERGQYGFLQELVRRSPTRRFRGGTARRATSRPRVSASCCRPTTRRSRRCSPRTTSTPTRRFRPTTPPR